MSDPGVRFHTVQEVAALLRVSKMTVYRLVHDGTLPSVRVGRSYRLPVQGVRALLAGALPDVDDEPPHGDELPAGPGVPQ